MKFWLKKNLVKFLVIYLPFANLCVCERECQCVWIETCVHIASAGMCVCVCTVPFSSCSLSLACSRRSVASCCRISALFLASATPPAFCVIRSSTVLYLSFSSESRSCTHSHIQGRQFILRRTRLENEPQTLTFVPI